jgi:hypothetical protein
MILLFFSGVNLPEIALSTGVREHAVNAARSMTATAPRRCIESEELRGLVMMVVE